MKIMNALKDRNSISARIRQLILYLTVPLCVLSLFMLLVFIIYSVEYTTVSRNISTASRFNQNFKDEVDLKMYYFVTGSEDEVPLGEVTTAKELAAELLSSTRNKESRKAAGSVLNLCDNLSDCIASIESMEGYDSRMHSLETNVYVLTELIQEYMYTYLYHEAGELAAMQDRIWILLLGGVLISAAVIITVVALSLRQSFRISRSITRPVDELYSRVEEIGQGDLTARPPVEAQDSKLQALGEGLEEMVTRLNDQMELNRQEQIRLRGMELALMQAQINPHFLYNTLDAIMWLIETGKNDQAVEMVSSLSNYFRSFLSNGKDIITLREEEMHVRSYLEIQQVRYKDVLQYEIDMDPALDECLVPKMTLQPLVENAIYHGIKSKRGGGSILISSRREGGRVVLRVKDTGTGMDPETLEKLRRSLENGEGSGFGMLASYKRLKLVYDQELDFRLESEENVGTTVTIRIPFRTEENSQNGDEQ